MSSARPIAITGARLVDPESGYDGPGAVIVAEGVIAEVARTGTIANLSSDIEILDSGGAMLIPGLIDLRVKTGEPGSEPKETLKSAAAPATSRGSTSTPPAPAPAAARASAWPRSV
jgi:dihydroorotase